MILSRTGRNHRLEKARAAAEHEDLACQYRKRESAKQRKSGAKWGLWTSLGIVRASLRKSPCQPALYNRAFAEYRIGGESEIRQHDAVRQRVVNNLPVNRLDCGLGAGKSGDRISGGRGRGFELGAEGNFRRL